MPQGFSNIMEGLFILIPILVIAFLAVLNKGKMSKAVFSFLKEKSPLFVFLFWLGLAAFSVYHLIWQGMLAFGAFALFSYPNKNVQEKIADWLKGIWAIGVSFFYIGVVILLIVGFFWLIGKGFGSIGNIGKYDGMTAEEWADEQSASEANYQELRTCIDDALSYSYDYSESHSAVQECYDNSSF